MRRYDRTGASTLEIALNTLEFAPEATAKRRVIQDQDEKGKPIDLKPVINAVGVDPVSGDIWIAVDDELVHYNSTGDRKGETYRTFTAEGTRVAPVSILVEPSRLNSPPILSAYTPLRGLTKWAAIPSQSQRKNRKPSLGRNPPVPPRSRSNLSKTIVSIACEMSRVEISTGAMRIFSTNVEKMGHFIPFWSCGNPVHTV